MGAIATFVKNSIFKPKPAKILPQFAACSIENANTL
jgi:hypothetical protein